MPDRSRWAKIGKDDSLAIEQQVRAAFNGHKFNNGWAWIVNEYLTFKCLAEIGFRADVDEIDDRIAEAFVVISNKINALQNEDAKRGRK